MGEVTAFQAPVGVELERIVADTARLSGDIARVALRLPELVPDGWLKVVSELNTACDHLRWAESHVSGVRDQLLPRPTKGENGGTTHG